MSFLLSPLLTASLGAGPGRPHQNCSIKAGLKPALSALGIHSHPDHSLPKACPSSPVSPREARSVAPGALGVGERGVWASSLVGMEPIVPDWQKLLEMPEPQQGACLEGRRLVGFLIPYFPYQTIERLLARSPFSWEREWT